MASPQRHPNITLPVTYSLAPFGGPKAQGSTLPSAPRVRPKGVAPTKASYGYSRQLAEQAAMQQGLDPKYFVRQLSYISGLNPTARNQGRGIAGLQVAGVAKVNPWDPQRSLDYTAKILSGLALLRAQRR